MLKKNKVKTLNEANTEINPKNLFWITLLALAVAIPVLNFWNIPIGLALIAVFVMGLSLWIFSKPRNVKKIRGVHVPRGHVHTAHLIRTDTIGNPEIDVLHPGTPSIAGLTVTPHAHKKSSTKKPKSAHS